MTLVQHGTADDSIIRHVSWYRIFHLEHKTSCWMRSKINFLVGPQESLLATIKRRRLAQLGHVTRMITASPKPSLRTPLEGGRRRGQQRKCWMDNIKEWTSLPMPELLTTASCREKTGRGSLLNRPSCPTPPPASDDPIGQRTKLN